ncbi:hypothetical protein Prudu_000921, partial [Prunus dulcis]
MRLMGSDRRQNSYIIPGLSLKKRRQITVHRHRDGRGSKGAKFKEGTSESQIDQLIQGYANLVNLIDPMKSFH